MAEEEYRRQKAEDSLPRRSRPAGRVAKAGSKNQEARSKKKEVVSSQ
jgi:hypothetical protein